MERKTIRRGSGKRVIQGKDLRLAGEVRYIQNRAADRDARIVMLGPLVLFSTETGDAWLLDPADHLALRLARDGDPLPAHIEETETTFATVGQASIASKDRPSSASINKIAGSQPSSDTRRRNSPKRQEREI